MASLPAPPPPFAARKTKILQQLAVPDAEYSDLSPKGSVDASIRDLIDELNRVDGLVTTSSCGGRVSVFLEGRKDAAAVITSGAGGQGEENPLEERQTQAGVGGKGGGGTWLYVSHDPVELDNVKDQEALMRLFGVEAGGELTAGVVLSSRLIHFKFEPMILHVLTASPSHAQLLLKCAMQSGFRESGALNIAGDPAAVTPMVAVRTMGLSFESLVGLEDANGRRTAVVPPGYLRSLLRIGNERFVENTKRIARFREALGQALAAPPQARRIGDNGGEWEDAAARRERKRAEGLRRREELVAAEAKKAGDEQMGNGQTGGEGGVDVTFPLGDELSGQNSQFGL